MLYVEAEAKAEATAETEAEAEAVKGTHRFHITDQKQQQQK